MTDWCQLNVCISSKSLYVFYYLACLRNTGWLFIKDAILYSSMRKNISLRKDLTETCLIYNQTFWCIAGFGYLGNGVGLEK